MPFDHRWGPEEWSRYQSIDDTIVQLFISQDSVLITRVDRIQSKSPQSSGASVAAAKTLSWLQLQVSNKHLGTEHIA